MKNRYMYMVATRNLSSFHSGYFSYCKHPLSLLTATSLSWSSLCKPYQVKSSCYFECWNKLKAPYFADLNKLSTLHYHCQLLSSLVHKQMYQGCILYFKTPDKSALNILEREIERKGERDCNGCSLVPSGKFLASSLSCFLFQDQLPTPHPWA